ncbi:MAG: hemolysin family protein [bacterium]
MAKEETDGFLSQILNRFSRRYRINTEEDIQEIIEEGEKGGLIEEEEKEMIDSIFEVGDTIVREIMVPRVDMDCISSEISLEELLRFAIESGHSRVPVYKEKVDNIVGVIYTKDLLSYCTSDKISYSSKISSIENLIRPPWLVPETKPVLELLKEFQKKKIHLAIVIDEYGGIAGLVTLEDILEEIVGDIMDEYDEEEGLLSVIEEGKAVLVSGKIDIEEIEDFFGKEITISNDFETVGGLIVNLLGHVPLEGERVTYDDLLFTVKKSNARVVLKVEVRRVSKEEKKEVEKIRG